MKKIVLVFLLTALSLHASNGMDMEALAANANDFYGSFNTAARSIKWILAIIPVLVIGKALAATAQKYGHMKDEANSINHAHLIIKEIQAIALSLSFSLLALFIVYGTFVKVYASPTGTTFVNTWQTLVSSFWMEIVSKINV
jgi:hypothetical protein